MPAVDLTKLKKTHQKTRNYVAISHTQRKVKEKDLLFINESSFTQLGSSYGVSNKTLKKAAQGGGMVVKSMNLTKTGGFKMRIKSPPKEMN